MRVALAVEFAVAIVVARGEHRQRSVDGQRFQYPAFRAAHGHPPGPRGNPTDHHVTAGVDHGRFDLVVGDDLAYALDREPLGDTAEVQPHRAVAGAHRPVLEHNVLHGWRAGSERIDRCCCRWRLGNRVVRGVKTPEIDQSTDGWIENTPGGLFERCAGLDQFRNFRRGAMRHASRQGPVQRHQFALLPGVQVTVLALQKRAGFAKHLLGPGFARLAQLQFDLGAKYGEHRAMIAAGRRTAGRQHGNQPDAEQSAGKSPPSSASPPARTRAGRRR